MKTKLFGLLLVLAISSCSVIRFNIGDQQSILVFASGSELFELQTDGELTKILDFSEQGKALIRFKNIEKISNDLIAVQMNDYSVATINLKSKELKTLTSVGECPRFIKSIDSIVFFRGNQLIKFSLVDNKETVYPHSFNDINEYVCPLLISDSEIAFYDKNALMKFNIKSGEVESYQIKNCKPIYNTTKKDRFVCFNDNKLVVTDGGEIIEKLPKALNGKGVYVDAYEPVSQLLFFTRVSFSFLGGEERDLWVYDLNDQSESLVSSNFSISRGGVVRISR